jgi:hypothetical protein
LNGLTDRQLSLLVAFPVFMALAIILGLLILRRDPKYKANQFFALSFWLNAAALLCNLLYLFSTDPTTISALNKASIILLNAGVPSMLLSILILLRGEKEILQRKITYLFIATVVILMIIHNFLPVGVTMPEYTPRWSLEFGLFQIFFAQTLFIGLLYFSICLYREITPEMQRKFKRFIYGSVFIDITSVSITIQNMQIIPNYDTIGGIFNLGAAIGIILIYYGIVRR